MIRKDIQEIIKNFLVFVVLQLFFVNKLILFDKAFCFFYIGFLVLLPVNIGRIAQLLLGFGIGLMVDLFFDTTGIHASACVLLMFIRPTWITITTGGLDDGELLNTRNLGLTSFVTYLSLLVFLHHAMVFIIEGYGFSGFFAILGKVFSSTLFTIVVISVIQLIMLPSKRRI